MCDKVLGKFFFFLGYTNLKSVDASVEAICPYLKLTSMPTLRKSGWAVLWEETSRSSWSGDSDLEFNLSSS